MNNLCFFFIIASNAIQIEKSNSSNTEGVNQVSDLLSHLPLMSGAPTKICRSKRPGRNKAGSRMSTLFVAANTTTFVVTENPIKR